MAAICKDCGKNIPVQFGAGKAHLVIDCINTRLADLQSDYDRLEEKQQHIEDEMDRVRAEIDELKAAKTELGETEEEEEAA